MARKKKEAEEALPPVEAITAAFKASKDELRCVSMQEGGRVESSLSTNSLVADLKLGSGFQRGRVVHIFGPEASGKSTFLQEMVVSAQSLPVPIPVIHYDPEHSADPNYMTTQGVDLLKTIESNKKKYPGYFYTQPDTGESIYRHLHRALNRFPDIDQSVPGPPSCLILIDSVAAMFSQDRDQETGDGAIGLEARMHSRYLPITKKLLKQKGALLVASNQIRMNINLRMPGVNPETFPGGNAWKFYPDYAIRVHGRKKDEEDKTGLFRQHVWARTQKNKTFPSFQAFEWDIILGRGIDKAEDAKEFLDSLGKLETVRGKHRILLKKFDTGKVMSWEKFRGITESPEFRSYCFNLLRQDKVYMKYLDNIGYLNYSYDNKEKEDTEIVEEEATDGQE